MFSLKPPRPSFRSYLLPPPQVSKRSLLRARAARDLDASDAGQRSSREPRARWKLVELRGGHSLAEVLRSLVLPCDETLGTVPSCISFLRGRPPTLL